MTGYPIEDARSLPGAGTPSREVKFYPVYEMLSPMLADPRLIPGTPVWCQLDDTDPAKWQAILWSAVWWAIAEECRRRKRWEFLLTVSPLAVEGGTGSPVNPIGTF